MSGSSRYFMGGCARINLSVGFRFRREWKHKKTIRLLQAKNLREKVAASLVLAVNAGRKVEPRGADAASGASILQVWRAGRSDAFAQPIATSDALAGQSQTMKR